MTNGQYQELVEFLAGKFEGIDQRFDAVDRRFDGLEQRTAAVEVGLESVRDEVRVVAEGVQANSARIDRLETSMNGRFDRMEEIWLDHEGRIRALEDS